MSTNPISNDLFLRACRREAVERTPVWFMRQAGRYLPEYRAVREKVDFLTLCKTPELAARVTVQPVEIIGVDAAIVFSDILVLPEAMGMTLFVHEGKGGPHFAEPVRSRSAIDRLVLPDPAAKLRFVTDALRTSKRELQNRVPLIGFSGAPWTLAAYMVEGRGSKDFRHIKGLIYDSPGDAHVLLEKLSQAVGDYLLAQIDAGADAIQIFDTWGGVLGKSEFEEFSLRHITSVVSRVRGRHVPIIVFCKDCSQSLEPIASCGADVVSLDWKSDIGEARAAVGHRVALQGNLDPVVLFGSKESVERGVRRVLEKFGHGNGHIFNLGHGILPDTPVANVRTFVEAVKTLSVVYHREPAGVMRHA